ncbi:MAG TPA: GTPase Era [Actinomycetes bacterium]|nr:GTPase Era [Actinomycetes bacterium]
MKSGLVALVGRPNVGKSTLLNGLLGRKLAIMSDKPQTTRSVVRGVLHRPEGQAVLVDTPGLHKPRTLLGQRLNDLVRGTLAEVDLVLLLVDAAAGVGGGDRFLAAEVERARTPTLCVVNKLDAVTRAKLAATLQAAAELGDWAEVVPVSARTGEQLDLLASLVLAHLPEGRPLYPDDQVTDQPEEHLVAEMIREKALALVRDELPHSVAVLVDELGPDPEREDLLVVRATLFVERASQKPIVLGRRGTVLREIGTRARTELEALFGSHVYLDLHVKVAKEWQRDPRQLARLGF